MYLFYIDEAGSRDPQIAGLNKSGAVIEKDPIYVLTAIGLFDQRWKKFYRHITGLKRQFKQRIEQTHDITLDLADCEIKSNWLRIPKAREQRPFIKHLTTDERDQLVAAYYGELNYHHMAVISVVIDKRKLKDFFDAEKLHRKAWELLCERVEQFMAEYHAKHKALLICDDMSRQENHALAMKHAYLLDRQTSAGLRLNHIVEMPLFVRSELSEGVQLADLCAYNFYRAFKMEDTDYAPLAHVLPHICVSRNTSKNRLDGLKVFPNDSQLQGLGKEIERKGLALK